MLHFFEITCIPIGLFFVAVSFPFTHPCKKMQFFLLKSSDPFQGLAFAVSHR